MGLKVANHSSYPRIGDQPKEQRLRRALGQRDRGELSEGDLEVVFREVTAETLSEEERAGVDLVTDGQIRWSDPVSHLMRFLKGVRVGGLLRFFDTNFYFRVPIVEGEVERKDGLLTAEVTAALSSAKRPFNVVLTGPAPLASLSEVRGSKYSRAEDLIDKLTSVLAAEIQGLSRERVSWIQIEEPILLRRPDLLPSVAVSLVEFSKKKGKVPLVLSTYFGDATPLYDKIQELSVDGLHWDLSYGGDPLTQRISSHPGGKTLFLGVVDGRSTRLEATSELKKRMDQLRVDSLRQEVYVTSSCGLEYLPRARAFDKLKRLAELKGNSG